MTEKFFDRELSWIEFNARVLSEGMDETNPLLERLKFHGIVSSNFDEFFMVRMAEVKNDRDKALAAYEKAFNLIKKQDEYFLNVLVPEMHKAGIERILPQSLTDRQFDFVKNFFAKELLPLLTPVALRENQPLPILVNLALYMAVALLNVDTPSEKHYALIEIPKNVSRMISLPVEKGFSFILLEDIVSLFSKELFVGYEISDTGLIRVTRAAEMTLDEEKDEDFSKVMSEAIRERRHNFIVRLEAACSKDILAALKKKLEVKDHQIYETKSWFDLKSISQLAFQPVFEDLKRPSWKPRLIPDYENADDIWAMIREKDVMVHHPYESFEVVSEFLAQAADDPDVLAIKMTLYRAGNRSSIISSLARAAEKGKQVTVLVELKARFDEENNIQWARWLESVGASVLYGVSGLKTHAKVCLVVRREADGIRRYVHLSTGNYNEKTAQIYCDIGLFTCNEQMTSEVSAFFNVITGYSQPIGFTKIEMAPYGLRKRIKRLIQREALLSTKEKPGLIIAKMNSLVDQDVIETLYQASKAGVKILLNVRGICCLRPGMKAMSENIEVISIVDMFLEHSRIFYFQNGGAEEVYLSSADWMPRNLDRRVEVMFPIENKKIAGKIHEILKLYFEDNVKSWKLLASGEYQKIVPGTEKKFRVQEFFSKKASERESSIQKSAAKDIKPQKPKNAPVIPPKMDYHVKIVPPGNQ